LRAEAGRAWRRFVDASAPPREITAARILLAGTALWIVLSRPDLLRLLELPAESWSMVPWARRLRFGLVLPPGVEWGLWATLHLALVAALFGVKPRLTCALAAVLLFHFAPLEAILWTPNPYLRGLTLPVLGLVVVSAARPGDGWPVRLIRVLLVQAYFFAGWAKLAESGLWWATADNLRGWLLALDQHYQAPEMGASLARALAASPAACWILAVGGLAFELLSPLVLFSRRARLLFVPVALAFHLVNALAFHIVFQEFPLVLLFLDWDAVSAPAAGTDRGTDARTGA
jgi:hypothetical protein